MAGKTTVGQYLVTRLEQAGLNHIFGIPGDYVLGFYDLLVESKIDVVGTCTEIGAGFAADGYARVNGLGALCVTYCVGGLNVLNAVAGAYAEKSPVIAISGSPGLSERAHSPLLHHQVRDFNTQLEIYEKVTVAAVSLDDPVTAPKRIDHCITECLRQKRPVFIEIPRDMVAMPCVAPGPLSLEEPEVNSGAMKEAIAEAAVMINKAKRPVILAGVEIHRFGLQRHLLDLVEKAGLPVAATLLGKSVIRETHAQYLGVYEGALGRESVRRAVDGSDCVLILGAFMTDINLGIYTAKLEVKKTVNANSDRVSIRHHHYEDVPLAPFIKGLTRDLRKTKSRRTRKIKVTKIKAIKQFKPQAQRPINVKRFFERMDSYLGEDSVVIADIGDSLFGAADLTIHQRTEFLSPAYYTSMGFAVPAAIGAQINSPKRRPIVFVGDGAFQMTGMELSTIARYGLNPIVFVLNNKGFTTERYIHEGPYNDVHVWEYHLLPQVLRKGWGCQVRTEGELEEALITARNNVSSFSLINVHLDKLDRSDALVRLGKRMGEHIS